MTVTISAGHLQATIAEKGAELQSLIDVNTNLEYIWQADPALGKACTNLISDSVCVEGQSIPLQR